MADKNTYNFGLYGRCPVCKDITAEVCDGCGAKDSFTDSSRPGIVVCTKCKMEHSIECEKKSCNGQIKVLKTPKNEDERKRIDEFIYRKKHKDMDNREFVIKESAKKTIIKAVEVPIEDEIEKSGVIKLDAGMEELLANTRKSSLDKTTIEPLTASDSKPASDKGFVGLQKESFVDEVNFGLQKENDVEEPKPIISIAKEIIEPKEEKKDSISFDNNDVIMDTDFEEKTVELKIDEEEKKIVELKIDEEVVKEEILLKPEPKVTKNIEPVRVQEKQIKEEILEPIKEAKKEEINLNLSASESIDEELSSEVKQELDLIQDFWHKKDVTEQEEKKEEERRIVNQFYDEQDDTVLDKKINFENVYNETSYYDCKVCGKEEMKIVCDQCGQSNQFSLNYDALSCKCGNTIKVKTCDCGAKHGHSDFYLISEGIKWQYSKSKSYYNYRKGRLLTFSTCPTCNVFTVEKCKVCGSKVNFGAPNKNNEVYCKNCGTVNQFICDNRNCDNSVKTLKNPSSIEEKLDLLNEVMNFKSRINEKKVKYSEPGGDKKVASSSSSQGISIGNVSSTPDFTNSFIEEFDNKTKDLITNSFIEEVETEVNQRKKVNDELQTFNRDNFAPRAPGISLGGEKASEGEVDDEEGNVISFDDSSSSKGLYIFIIILIIAIGVGGWWAYNNFIVKGKQEVLPQSKEVVVGQPVVGEVSVVVDSTIVAVDSTAVVTPDSVKAEESVVPVEDKK
ncbi:MAG: hypothetical protein PF574_05165 [Candidatus Delongbacteria bacterium]|jgi:hypothetical protein|nr:hypothetical protein [Candidatus Delongbacteria bacterium]